MTSSPPGQHRLVAVGVPVMLAALVLGACGGSDGGASPSASTLSLNETTAFATIPPATSTTLPPTLEAGAESPVEQEYTVQAGDFPLGVAEKFGVSLDDLVAYNEWASAAQFPFPGEVIKIPPGGTVQGSSAPVPDGVETVTGGDAEGGSEPVGDTIPTSGDNCQAGSYTIQEGDNSRIKVAEKFDVTVEALDAANAQTEGYSAFYVGLQIVIPARDDC